MTSQRYHAIFEAAATKRFAVIGDLMLDEFVWGKVSRISPEAPVPVVHVTGESWYPGGAANVARNLCEFTPNVSVLGVVGLDEAAERLLGLLAKKGIDTAKTERDPGWQTVVKTRVIARQQQLVRVDRERPGAIATQTLRRLMESIGTAAAEADAIVVADYGKGVVSQSVADRVCEMAEKHGRILAVDPNPGNPVAWKRVTVIKPNRLEALSAAGLPADRAAAVEHDVELLAGVGRDLQARWNAELLLLTLGEEGMMLFERGKRPYHTPTRGREIFDVSGAGDTAMAALTLALAGGASPTEAAEIANAASGIVVGKLGTAVVTPAELEESFKVQVRGA